MSDSSVTDTDAKDTGSVVGNGLKVALIAGGVLGAGFLLWRLAYGQGSADDAEKKDESEAQGAAPATAAAIAPSASCACHGAPMASLPSPIDANLLAMMEALQPHGEPVVRVGNRWLTLPEVRGEVLRRMAA